MNAQETTRKLIANWSGLNETDITPEKELERDLLLDSLDKIEVAMAVEEKFEIELMDDDIEQVKTVGEFYAMVEKAIAAEGTAI